MKGAFDMIFSCKKCTADRMELDAVVAELSSLAATMFKVTGQNWLESTQ
jgi:hypothetical protein